jgi:hypothetical protein
MALAQKSPHARKPATEWTVEERLAVRFDRASIAERSKAWHASHSGAGDLTSQSSKPEVSDRMEYIVDGGRNPELFMPWELFDGLLSSADPRPGVRNGFRSEFSPKLRELGIDEASFWADVEAAGGSLARDRVARPGHGDHSPLTSDEICSRRFAAFHAAEARIGHDLLYRVLYEVLAPKSFNSTAGNELRPEQRIQREQEGCQR